MENCKAVYMLDVHNNNNNNVCLLVERYMFILFTLYCLFNNAAVTHIHVISGKRGISGLRVSSFGMLRILLTVAIVVLFRC